MLKWKKRYDQREVAEVIENIKSASMDTLFKSILRLKTIDDCYAFFDDVCTIHELQSFAQRLEVAAMLCEGKTYTEIGELTGASTATISRVNRSLNYGSGGYRLVLEKTKPENPTGAMGSSSFPAG